MLLWDRIPHGQNWPDSLSSLWSWSWPWNSWCFCLSFQSAEPSGLLPSLQLSPFLSHATLNSRKRLFLLNPYELTWRKALCLGRKYRGWPQITVPGSINLLNFPRSRRSKGWGSKDYTQHADFQSIWDPFVLQKPSCPSPKLFETQTCPLFFLKSPCKSFWHWFLSPVFSIEQWTWSLHSNNKVWVRIPGYMASLLQLPVSCHNLTCCDDRSPCRCG